MRAITPPCCAARLFGEIAQKSRELEVASQHKSQFVANMSHGLRTPLAAILGYAELMQEGFYEPLGQKSLDALTRIRSNGKHLLGLINTVLDIAKIESGQFTLNMTEYAIESVVETVRSATESLAQNKKSEPLVDSARVHSVAQSDRPMGLCFQPLASNRSRFELIAAGQNLVLRYPPLLSPGRACA
jgi:signal transduction histidine kinase